jgi:hypothetical protein
MPTAHTRYVTWISRGKRHHGSSAADITMPLTSDPQTMYSEFAPPSMMWSDGTGAHNAKFAFWSVTGAADGPHVTTNNQVHAPVGSTEIHATAWYIPEGGGIPGGGPGVLIDAFDVGLGNFVDDDFVDVLPDAGLTASANNDGFVSTAKAEDIRAFTGIHGVPFSDWTVIPEPDNEVVNNRDLQAAIKTTSIAFAFYQQPAGVQPPQFTSPSIPADATWVSFGVMVDGGGPTGHGPVDPWNPFLTQMAAGFALGNAVSKFDKELQGAVSEIASRQITLAAAGLSQQVQKQGH